MRRRSSKTQETMMRTSIVFFTLPQSSLTLYTQWMLGWARKITMRPKLSRYELPYRRNAVITRVELTWRMLFTLTTIEIFFNRLQNIAPIKFPIKPIGELILRRKLNFDTPMSSPFANRCNTVHRRPNIIIWKRVSFFHHPSRL